MYSVSEGSDLCHLGKSTYAQGLRYLTQPIKNHESFFFLKHIEYLLCARHLLAIHIREIRRKLYVQSNWLLSL